MTAIERAHIEQFRTIVAGSLGLHYEDGKLDYLADVLRQRMGSVGSSRFDSYVERLASSPKGSDELRALAEQLTVNETFFFRNTDHFRALAEAALPDRIRERTREKRLRILSAGCASGEEPYSLAVVVRDLLPDHASWDLKIIGIDVNPAVLAKAAQARYSPWSLRATPADAQRRYFRPDGRDFVLDPEIRKMVTFEERNLVEEDPLFWQSLACDIVFCRNVLMYFTPDSAQDVVRRIRQALLPGGFLFLGHAETLRGLTQEFHLCHTHDTFYYRLREASEPLITTAPWPKPRRDQAADLLPAAVEATASWVDAIQRASERIANLTDGRARSPNHNAPRTTHIGGAGSVAPRTWDLGLVLEAMRQERFADALALICSLPPDSHQDLDALLLRAVLLTNNGRLDESKEVCSRLLALDELNAGAHYLMALCREHAGDAIGAVEHDQTAIYLDAGFAMPHLHRGLMAKRSGDAVTAQRELGQALILLAREDASRILLFGGGFSRETLVQLCRAELRLAGGEG
ncbi:MAG TPA: CheR family methyltransferase [Gemmatimonadales bacterium]|nr:CheR family methyltransferase [Gemmatimonadales bacterium]